MFKHFQMPVSMSSLRMRPQRAKGHWARAAGLRGGAVAARRAAGGGAAEAHDGHAGRRLPGAPRLARGGCAGHAESAAQVRPDLGSDVELEFCRACGGGDAGEACSGLSRRQPRGVPRLACGGCARRAESAAQVRPARSTKASRATSNSVSYCSEVVSGLAGRCCRQGSGCSALSCHRPVLTTSDPEKC